MKRKKVFCDARLSRRLKFCVMALGAAMMPFVVTAQQQATNPVAKAAAQSMTPGDPVSTLAAILDTACRQDTAQFPNFLTTANANFYRQLKPAQQVAILRRLVLLDDAGRALLSTANDGSSILRCETPSVTRQIHLGTPRTDQNLSFVPIDVKPDRQIDFGLIATKDGWRLISLGVLMLDIAQLQPEWDAQDVEEREAGATAAMYKIWAAIDTYQKAFQKPPETLLQLGPAPKEGISPDAAGLLTAEMVSGTVAGYVFRYRTFPSGAGGVETQFELTAAPAEYGKTGKRSFFINASGKLRGSDKIGATATGADPLIDEGNSNH
jgi:hypothetical protein